MSDHENTVRLPPQKEATRSSPRPKSMRRVKNTKRVSFNLTNPQIARLKDLSNKSGLTTAELIRRAIDNYDHQS